MEELENNISRILDFQLEFENYQDNIGGESKITDNIFSDINKFRQRRKILSEKEQLKESIFLLEKLNKVMDGIGREKFTFYDDGSFNYIWDYSLLEGEEDGKRK